MADLTGLKKAGAAKPNRLGEAPSIEEASDNLRAPEHAPAPIADAAPIDPGVKVDGRTMRRTNRTTPLATRMQEAYVNRARHLAGRDNITIGELLERAIDAYEAANP